MAAFMYDRAEFDISRREIFVALADEYVDAALMILNQFSSDHLGMFLPSRFWLCVLIDFLHDKLPINESVKSNQLNIALKIAFPRFSMHDFRNPYFTSKKKFHAIFD